MKLRSLLLTSMQTLLLASLALLPAAAWAQGTPAFTGPTGQAAKAGDGIKLNEMVTAFRGKADAVDPTLSTAANPAAVRLGDLYPQNPSGNPGIAATYMGSTGIPDPGHLHGTNSHRYIQGSTRGWDEGTCIVSVMANSPTNAPGCSQGNFGDMAYRQAYGGQDSTGMFVSAQGIIPVANAAPVVGFDFTTVMNLAGQSQAVARVTFYPPLNAAQVAAMNAPHGPMRIETNNHFFGYLVPFGMTTQTGATLLPASADGTTVLVDNWTRAIPGSLAAPTLPYALPGGGNAAGTGLYPNQVGQTNGSAPLAAYTVTIDFNKDMDAYGATLRTTNADVLANIRFMEWGLVNDRTGAELWDDSNPGNDSTGGQPFGTHMVYGGCQNDDGKGNGHCGSVIFGTAGIKRIVICGNPSDNAGLGGTDCILDTQSFYGYKSTKTNGYTVWIDPLNTGTPVYYQDYQGNIQSKGFINVASLTVSGPAIHQSGTQNAGMTNGYAEQDKITTNGTTATTYARDGQGNSSQTGQMSATAVVAGSFSSSGNAGVSCAAGSVSLATLTVTNGIVTHC